MKHLLNHLLQGQDLSQREAEEFFTALMEELRNLAQVLRRSFDGAQI